MTALRTWKSASLMGLGLAVLAGLPAVAAAYDHDLRNYDGYCYAKKAEAQRNGTLIGAVAGGLIGGSVADTHNKGLGTVIGAVIGGVVGNSAGKSSVSCYNGEYYAYQGSYYDPPSPPPGYTVVYYQQRPSPSHYSHIYYDRYHHTTPPPYGYNDAWQSGDNPNGWRDDRGNWHYGSRPHYDKQHGHRHNHRGHN